MTGTISFDLTAPDGSHITGTASVTSMTVTPPEVVVPDPETILDTFLAGTPGDCWDTTNPAVCWADQYMSVHASHGGPCSVVQGLRGTMQLRQGGSTSLAPIYDAVNGSLRFGPTGELYNDPAPGFQVPLSSVFSFAAMGYVVRGYFRAVMVDHSQELGGSNHYPVWFDVRSSQTQTAGWVQDHQYKEPNSTIPWLPNIGGCGTGWTLIRMWREVAGGPAYIRINGQTATVQSGTIIGNADVRLFENENAYDHDFSVRNPYLNARNLSAAEWAIVDAWVQREPAVVVPPSGVTLDPQNNGGLALTNGNLTATQVNGVWVSAKGTSAVTTGVHSYTAHIDAVPHAIVGVGDASAPVSSYCGTNSDSCGYFLTNGSILPGSEVIDTAGVGATVKLTVDADARTMAVRIDGVLKSTHDISHIAGPLFPMVSLHSASGLTCDFSEWGA